MFWERGYRWMFLQTGMPGWMRAGVLPPCLQYLSKEQQIEFLKTQQEYLKKASEEIENKIKKLSEKKKV
jgi:trans-aconitate methyltransferase